MISIDDIKVGAIFPPYQLGDFQRCPRLWDYKKRWQPRDEGGRTALLVGTAVALGLEKHYTTMGDGQEKKVHDELCCLAGAVYVEQNYQEESDRTLEGVKSLVRRGIKHGMATDLGLSEVLGVERFYGRIRPDLVGRSSDGRLVVVDHKVKMNLDDRYKEKELLQYDTSNQFFHYAWGVGQEYGEAVDTVYAHLIVLAPRVYTEVHPVRISREHLALWLESAARDWAEMAKGENRGRFGACVDKYGACDFSDGCHVLYGDESRFEALYDKRERRF